MTSDETKNEAATAAEQWGVLMGDPEARPRKLLPDMGEIDATIQIYKQLGLQLTSLIANVQYIVDRFAAMDEIVATIQPQGPIEVRIPLKQLYLKE